MKNKFYLILLLSIVSSSILQSQTLTPSVVSSSGGYYTSANVSLSFTVAEMTMVQTFSSPLNILTQGFQQPEDNTVGIPEIPKESGVFLIYPNPTNGKFAVSFLSTENLEMTIRIYNLLQQPVLTKTVSQIVGNNVINLDISNYRQGIYILEFTYLNSKGEKVESLKKINLVY